MSSQTKIRSSLPRPIKNLLVALQGLKPASGMQFTQSAKDTLQASSGPAEAERKPVRRAQSLFSPTECRCGAS